ncbi:helix-turn-helix transcriptional regulator [Thioalkalivibrio paradoxus]|uniref:helix-turn-helix transcriptional regulator n=1 Tax=Thioalkalivibrio paradoxus TaxID=108010 RepID=UPI001E40D32B|nr:AlpA family phage regulatory protein [Thioalkalivibrio paradoxus]
MPAVLAATGISHKATIYAAMAAGTFPRPVRIGSRAVAWRSSDIAAWIATRPVAGDE